MKSQQVSFLHMHPGRKDVTQPPITQVQLSGPAWDFCFCLICAALE